MCLQLKESKEYSNPAFEGEEGTPKEDGAKAPEPAGDSEEKAGEDEAKPAGEKPAAEKGEARDGCEPGESRSH